MPGLIVDVNGHPESIMSLGMISVAQVAESGEDTHKKP